MLRNHYLKFIVAVLITALIAGVGLVPEVAATTWHTISVSPNTECNTWDFDADESFGTGVGVPATGDILGITWDETTLYIGIDRDTATASPFTYNVYLDTQANGASQSSTFSYNIAAAPQGYEYVFSQNLVGNSLTYAVGTTGSWVAGTPPVTVSSCGRSPSVKFAIPWSDIGGVPTRLTVFVEGYDVGPTLRDAWPVATGNVFSPPSFTQGIVFSGDTNTLPGANNVSPNGAPTAITLSNLQASNPQTSLLLLAGVLVAGTGTFLLLRRRARKVEI